MNLERACNAAGRHRAYVPLLLALAVLLLAGCSGQQYVASSWPGLTVNNNVAYVAFNQYLFALDPVAQRVQWQFKNPLNAKSTYYAAPALSDGVLVMGGYDNVLYGVDRETLAVRWSFHLASDRYIGSPVISDGYVYVATAGHELFALSLQELERLGGVEKADEARRQMEQVAIRWKFSASHGMWAAPLLTDRALYVTSLDHHIYALEVETGRLIWSKELAGAMAGQPQLSEDGTTLYVGNFDYSLYALDAATGEQRWEIESENWVWGQPTLAGDKLFFGDLGGYLYAVDSENGTVLWKQQVADTIRSEVVFDANTDRLYVAGRKVANPGNVSTRGVVLALDTATYRVIWEQAMGEAIYTSPVLMDGLLLVAPSQGEILLLTLNADTGVVQWRFYPTSADQ